MGLQKFAESLRPGNGIIAAIGVFTGFCVAGKAIAFPIELWLAMASAFVITGAGNLINDYFDIDIDKRLGKKPFDRPNILLGSSALLFAAGILIAYSINTHAFVVASLVSVLLIFYSGAMQKLKFAGNWVVALGTASTILFGAAIVQAYETAIVLAVAAFFANAAREIIKDCEDLKGDDGLKKTLPMLISMESVKKIVIALYVLAILSALWAWLANMVTGPYYIIFLLASIAVFFKSIKLLEKGKLRASQKYSKYGMVTALLAFLGGIL